MRVPNDKLVAKHSTGVDLFLGGHDHIYHIEQTSGSGNLFVKSGADFRTFSLIECTISQNPADALPTPEGLQIWSQDDPVNDANVKPVPHKYVYSVRPDLRVAVSRYEVKKDILPDPEILEYINECYRELDIMMQQVIILDDPGCSLS